ncbi:MAG: hypothetical protein BEN18_05565 [Epulopiscium sp. Nuni2H_MBin001]|nr:MAG: hypothetical protein BEN18_05565 [Epulopiscium sp. Nuni2H_MBin001]
MCIAYMIDTANKRAKQHMILTGIVIVSLSSTNFNIITAPIQNLVLSRNIQNTSKIEIYSYTSTYEQFILEITEQSEIDEWLELLLQSEPQSNWGYKTIPQTPGYKLVLSSSENVVDILITNQTLNNKNLFLGNTYLGYYNSAVAELIENIHPLQPEVLTITHFDEISIHNEAILTDLWNEIIWSTKEPIENYHLSTFPISAYLVFEEDLGCKIFFTTDFTQAYIVDQGVMLLSSKLQRLLLEQYTLSQLTAVESFRIFEPAYTSSNITSYVDFYIEPDENGLFYGLYRENYKTQEKIFLHNITSLESNFFIISTPYLLLLDCKGASQYDLMLVNQNIPESHRYMVKNQNIIPTSIAICPHNTNFTYIIENQDNSTLFYVDNYYQSPKPIISGDIDDSIFLSDKYIAFTQTLNNNNLLCVYDTQLGKIVKYTYLNGNAHFIDSYHNQVLFALQAIEDSSFKEGVFILHNDLTITLTDFYSTEILN